MFSAANAVDRLHNRLGGFMSGRYHGLAYADRVLAFLVRDGELMGTKVEPRNALPAEPILQASDHGMFP